MTEAIPAELRAFVVERAELRCEYCRLAQVGQEATFHIDHVVPRSVGGAEPEAVSGDKLLRRRPSSPPG